MEAPRFDYGQLGSPGPDSSGEKNSPCLLSFTSIYKFLLHCVQVLNVSTSLTQTSTLLLYLLRVINPSFTFNAPRFRHLSRVSLWVGSPFCGSGLASGPGLLHTTCRFLYFTVTSVRSATASRASCVLLLSGERSTRRCGVASSGRAPTSTRACVLC